jgi:uncharacterized protein with HEPN domain
MLDDLDRILFYAEHVDFSDPEHNEQALDAIGFRLNHLRQMSQELSADFVRAHPELKLKAISQFMITSFTSMKVSISPIIAT